jgi:hypothetical protein
MIGTAAALDRPALGRPASIGPDGSVRWELTVTAWRRRQPGTSRQRSSDGDVENP